MRRLAWCARHPRLRTGLVFLAVAVVFMGGLRLWTSVPPDAVRITITQNTPDSAHGVLLPLQRVIYDRTIRNHAIAERLHRDFARMPIFDLTFDPFAAYPCISHLYSAFDTYALTWYRAGSPLEQASTDPTDCRLWESDGVFVHEGDQDTLNADIAAAVKANS
jgi:hypothetical protein